MGVCDLEWKKGCCYGAEGISRRKQELSYGERL